MRDPRRESPYNAHDLFGPVIVSCSFHFMEKLWRCWSYELIIVIKLIHHLHPDALSTSVCMRKTNTFVFPGLSLLT